MSDTEFVRRLRDEIARWRDDGTIDDDLAARLRERYPEAGGRSRVAAWIAFLGAVLVGAGVIAFFASNWQFLPGWSKLALAIGAMVSAQVSGYRLRYGDGTYVGTGNALLFLGAPLYGAALFLVAQGMHVNADAPSLLVLWALGIVPMALLLRSRSQMLLALLALGVAAQWEAVFWLDMEHGIAAYLAVPLLVGVLLWAGGAAVDQHPRWDVFAEPVRLLGVVVAMGALLPMAVPGLDEGLLNGASLPPAALLPSGGLWRLGALTAAVALTGILAWRRGGSPWVRGEAAAWAVLTVVALGTLLLPLPRIVVALGTNLLLLALVVGTIGLGVARRQPGLVNVAVCVFVVQAGSRYVDLFWEQVPAEVFFLTTGALLLAGGMAIERGRRHLIGQIRAAGEEPK